MCKFRIKCLAGHSIKCDFTTLDLTCIAAPPIQLVFSEPHMKMDSITSMSMGNQSCGIKVMQVGVGVEQWVLLNSFIVFMKLCGIIIAMLKEFDKQPNCNTSFDFFPLEYFVKQIF